MTDIVTSFMESVNLNLGEKKVCCRLPTIFFLWPIYNLYLLIDTFPKKSFVGSMSDVNLCPELSIQTVIIK